MVTAFGVPLGLRADVLVAGLLGSLIGIILLNTVPGSIDTWPELVRTTLRRMAVAGASAILAGYSTPVVLLISNIPDSLLLGVACVVGAGSQQVLNFLIRRFAPPAPVAGQGANQPGGQP
jgi:drug/metabolite transporter (DMT)-like permease